MPQYRIICTEQEPAGVPNDRAHIVRVGTGVTATQYSRKWTLAEVIKAMDNGDTFHTVSESTGKIAQVVKYQCAVCKGWHIKSSPDAVKDNNLDNLRTCS